MAAKMPFVEQPPRMGTVASTSGVNAPLETRPTLAGIASPKILKSPSEQNQGQDGQRPDDGPSKRTRQPERTHIPEFTSDCTGLSGSPSDRPMDDSTTSPELSRPRPGKREHELWIAANHDSYLAPYNSEEFLSDANWELTRLTRRRNGTSLEQTDGNGRGRGRRTCGIAQWNGSNRLVE
ncbi:hypothetical protein AK830_g4278 [Neonectria ditissima]|uniref:Uncharacterized protein n=1 Tax=Neonectria ditissima TaxID=78410 RepID=A0A0N8H7N9_9HYPO|nr:hypothetical protein AK830_g4278 [Neonectria ditissima]